METLLLLAMMATIAFASTPSFAQGASNSAPGQKMRATPRKEDKGASTFAPRVTEPRRPRSKNPEALRSLLPARRADRVQRPTGANMCPQASPMNCGRLRL